MIENQVKKIGDILFDERDISPSQIKGVTSRQINYWIENAIVPFVQNYQPLNDNTPTDKIFFKKGDKPTKNRWVRLNLTQAIWVSIVKELLSFGVSIESLKDLARKVWHEPRKDRYADDIFKKHIKQNRLGLTEESIEKLKLHLEDELIMNNYFRTIINPFTEMIKSVILRQGHPHSLLYVPETKEFEVLAGNNELMLKLGSSYLENSLICIPVIPIISKILTIDFGNTKKELSYLTNIEKQIRDIIVFKRPKIVEIAFEENHIKPIVVTEEHKSREQLSRYILENKIAKGSKLLIDIRSQDNYKLTLINKK